MMYKSSWKLIYKFSALRMGRVIGFVIDYMRLNFEAFEWRRINCHAGWKSNVFPEIWLSEHFLFHIKYYFNIFEFLER